MISKKHTLALITLVAVAASTSAFAKSLMMWTPRTAIVNNASALEGDQLNFVVTLSHPSSGIVRIFYSTADGEALGSDAGCVMNGPNHDSADFSNSSDFVTFQPGELQKIIKIYTCEDRFVDASDVKNMHLIVELDGAGYTVVNETAVGTIIEDGDYGADTMAPTP